MRSVQLAVLVLVDAALVVTTLGCGASQADVAAAALGTGVAAGFSAYERSQGGCYAVCTNGTVCNPSTGYCERQPCKGACRSDETCKLTPEGERCEPMMTPDLGVSGTITAPPPTREPGDPRSPP